VCVCVCMCACICVCEHKCVCACAAIARAVCAYFLSDRNYHAIVAKGYDDRAIDDREEETCHTAA
jgi:hypothetical protein